MSCPEGQGLYSAYPPASFQPMLSGSVHHHHHHHLRGHGRHGGQHHHHQPSQSSSNQSSSSSRRAHPPPLAQRERSTSAPNVCYNMVGAPGALGGSLGLSDALEEWSNRIRGFNLAGTGESPLSFLARLRVPHVVTIFHLLIMTMIKTLLGSKLFNFRLELLCVTFFLAYLHVFF